MPFTRMAIPLRSIATGEGHVRHDTASPKFTIFIRQMHPYNIRSATVEDAVRLVEIYNPYVANTAISFEESPVSSQEMAARIKKVEEANGMV